MAISPYQASLLNFLVKLTATKWAVEVGTFTGTSSISIARGLAPGGKLICFDQDETWTGMAQRYWQKAGVQDQIELRLGPAGERLRDLRPSHSIDFVFIDADKPSYDLYYETLLPHVRQGGLIIFDNMLRGGQVIDPVRKNTPENRAVDELNHKLSVDPRVQSILIPIADGLHLCRKI